MKDFTSDELEQEKISYKEMSKALFHLKLKRMMPGSFYVARISMGDHELLSVYTQQLKCDLRLTANSLLSLVKGYCKANFRLQESDTCLQNVMKSS